MGRGIGAGGARRAFGLVELLVVTLVIGVLLALLLPAVQSAREAARRTRCASNLRQMGLALHHFEQARSYLPPGSVGPVAVATEAHVALSLPTQVEQGWVPFLLPYLGPGPLAQRYELRTDWRANENREAREACLEVVQCPSTPHPTRLDSGTIAGQRWRAAPADYAAVSGVAVELHGLGLIDADTRLAPHGMLRLNRLPRLAENRDGLSSTIWIAEVAGRPFRYRANRRRQAGRTSGGGWADRENPIVLHGSNAEGTSSRGPCPLNCTNDNEIYAFHPKGAQALGGDGAVHFVSQQIDLRLLARLITIAAGEPFTFLE